MREMQGKEEKMIRDCVSSQDTWYFLSLFVENFDFQRLGDFTYSASLAYTYSKSVLINLFYFLYTFGNPSYFHWR